MNFVTIKRKERRIEVFTLDPMAISFSDLHSESGHKSLDEFLSGKTFITGDVISNDDIKVFAAVSEKPGEGFPHARRWYENVAAVLASRFPGKAVGVKILGQAAASGPAPASEAAKEAADDDDLDLFGDETEEEKKAAEEREAAAKASSKKKESGKSSVLLDVKPWDDETDMKKLEEAVRSIEMPGLLWGASKLVPVGYGIKKLQIMMTIVDDLVSVDSLIEERLTVEPCNEYIQSCDIVAFNKI
ncbi:elongation factor 1-beta 2-like [Typha angustifolia]|uniref:elongation factor 1-beta 2-like n=1 Tax=Typha angustifolia TaxID=59011 RepID=UPI003C2C0259